MPRSRTLLRCIEHASSFQTMKNPWRLLFQTFSFHASQLLAIARKLIASKEILLWMTPSEAPKALQASECSELLDPTGASCWIVAQH